MHTCYSINTISSTECCFEGFDVSNISSDDLCTSSLES